MSRSSAQSWECCENYESSHRSAARTVACGGVARAGRSRRHRRRRLSLVRRQSRWLAGHPGVAAAHSTVLRPMRLRSHPRSPPRSPGSPGVSQAVSRRRPPESTRRSPHGSRARQPQRSSRRHRRLLGLTRLAVLLIVVAVVVWAGARVAHAADGSEHLNGTVHVVRSGDTVWSIVVAQYGGARHDVRQLVDQVEQANGLHGRPIRPGDRLRLPYVE
jgi:LysM domain